jgi:hypothetical protein
MNISAAKENMKTYKQMKRPVLILNLGIGLKAINLPVKRQNRGHNISRNFYYSKHNCSTNAKPVTLISVYLTTFLFEISFIHEVRHH